MSLYNLLNYYVKKLFGTLHINKRSIFNFMQECVDERLFIFNNLSREHYAAQISRCRQGQCQLGSSIYFSGLETFEHWSVAVLSITVHSIYFHI